MLDMNDIVAENVRLKQENKELRQTLEAVQEKLEAAEAQIQTLVARLSQNSQNSNWPSSRDKRRVKKGSQSQRRQSGKHPGGQKGHQGHTLEFSQKPQHIKIHRPEICQHCQASFSDEQSLVACDKRQVFDLPPLAIVVTEHRAETLLCAKCGQMTRGDFPADVTNPTQYGPGIQQLAVYLKNEQLIPYDRGQQFFADLFGLNLSPATLQNITTKAAQRLKAVVAQIKAAITDSQVGHFDESGFYISGQRHWLHSASTSHLTYYQPHPRRGRKATDEIGILPRFTGTAIHDFWSAYLSYTQCKHGLCNSHHVRDLTAILENEKQAWASRFQTFLLSTKQLVEQARLAGLTALPAQKVEQIERLYAKLVGAALQANQPPKGGWPQGKRGRVKKTKARNVAERFENHQSAVLAFVYDFKVPFDNNLAERDIRMLKVQQKISGCFRSWHGAEAFCLIRSYTSTIRKQGLSVWQALASLFAKDFLMPQFTPV
jgi:transposase